MMNKAIQTDLSMVSDNPPAQLSYNLMKKSNTTKNGNSIHDNPTRNAQLIKTDALWKPIIRKFRQYVRYSVLKVVGYNYDESKSASELGRLFGRALNLSRELLD